MSSSKCMDKLCCAAFALSLLLTVLFMNGEALGIEASAWEIGYESRLFDTARVHTIDIVMDDWDGFLDTCENEEYAACNVVIDGEAYKNVGLRAKGNTSLSSVSQMGSDRYSFKIEFDQYDRGKSYHGLDKLCLNNLIQDNTYMKDYLTYQLMSAFGVDSPLCSYVYITVNGEDWGLYLAVEGIEDSFLLRNYGSDYGALYKPDSMSFGGGRGNGKEFKMDDFMGWQGESQERPAIWQESANDQQRSSGNTDGFSPPSMPGGKFGGMGSSDVKLQYIDDDPNSYPNIFENAKTELSRTDQQRLIAALKSLSAYEDLETVLDMDEVLRYFVVHNFVVNGDSYTGSMIHNYYLYEHNGQLSMIPWDYNLAFGTFQAGSADSAVNEPIDEALTDRPMQAWIFSDETYTERYHALFAEFLNTVDIDEIVDSTYGLIAPYVERDPTKFCAYAEFEIGVQTLKSFCGLRAQSVSGQLNGTIPATESAQDTDASGQIDASGLVLSNMGSMGEAIGGPGGGRDFDPGSFEAGEAPASQVPAFNQQMQRPLPEPNENNGFSQPGTQGTDGPAGGQSAILLGLSVLTLCLGVLIAKRFRA